MWRALLLCLLAGPALAGPWVRDRGGYLQFSVDQTGGGPWTALYVERGLAPALAPGLAFGALVGGHEHDSRALLFLARRLDLGPPAALRLGGGAIRTDRTRAAALIGLSVGRALDGGIGPGWAALDLDLILAGRATQLKADATLGLHRDPWRLAVALQTTATRGGLAATLVPRLSRATALGDVQVGLRLGDDPGLRLALIREF